MTGECSTPEQAPFKVLLEPEAINKLVSESILKSVLGAKLNEAIKSEVERITRTYDNPYSGIIKQLINEEIAKVIRTTYADAISAKVKELVTQERIEAVVEKIFEKLARDY